VTRGEGPTPQTAAAHAFVADLDAPELAPETRHHLQRVRRLSDGEPITVGDGQGAWRVVAFGPVLTHAGPVTVDPPSRPPITIAFAPAKGERPEWVVQKLTELGVDRIVPLRAARGVVRWDGERAARQVERLRRVAREAAAQSRRTWLPEVAMPVTFADAIRWPDVMLAEREGGRPTLDSPTVLVGPEGGWAPEERETAKALGVALLGLGPHVLRAETAAVAAGALLTAERHWPA
jgi:16S rRNA (uracil1498-N3)-methyltransferase